MVLKILNNILNIFKILLLIICFVLTFYVVLNNCIRMDKSFIKSIYHFIPFILLFILFALNYILKHDKVMNCTFYNITCCVVLFLVLFVLIRTLTDDYMILYKSLGYGINFNYFMDIFFSIKIMLYGLSLTNILLIIRHNGLKILK